MVDLVQDMVSRVNEHDTKYADCWAQILIYFNHFVTFASKLAIKLALTIRAPKYKSLYQGIFS